MNYLEMAKKQKFTFFDFLALPFSVIGFLCILAAWTVGGKFTFYRILDIFETVSKD